MYGKLPVNLGQFQLNVKELFSYTYLPIKLLNGKITIEERLECFLPLIYECESTFLKYHTFLDYNKHYIYLTAKNLYQRDNNSFNRNGWHSDSYKDNDEIYLWSSCQPTVFNTSQFILSEDDDLALKEIELQANPNNNVIYPNNSLLKLDQFCIHKVGNIIPGIRTFFKLVFSKNKFNLEGNSHNYKLSYNWKMYPRKEKRNIPYVID